MYVRTNRLTACSSGLTRCSGRSLLGRVQRLVILTKARNRTPSSECTQSTPISWKSILILSSHLRLCFPIRLFPLSFATKIRYSVQTYLGSRDSSVGIVTSLQSDRCGVRVPERAGGIFIYQNILNGCGENLAFCSVGTERYFRKVKTAGA
jgi:hypothetical protein